MDLGDLMSLKARPGAAALGVKARDDFFTTSAATGGTWGIQLAHVEDRRLIKDRAWWRPIAVTSRGAQA